MTTSTADLWHHYGRTRHATDRAVPDRFSWSWGQDSGPGAAVLGDLTGRRVADLGAGTARHAAHLAVHHRPAHVVAVDASPAQHAMAGDLYGHLAPRLRLVHCDVTGHLHAATGTYDVLYSVFGAVDFTEPRELLPAAASALRPGGRLVFSTLAHHLGGAPAHPDVQHTEIGARTPDGEGATMRRWVLQEQVWTKLLDEAAFTRISTETLPGGTGPRAADALLVTAFRTDRPAA
ncbi:MULTISPECIES: class I SAM-dependent methyltransferase [unclassified Streptomyces]|uniref:class I SAM-dependent methyltransferase n=1 Tax=unclassified Streptomyces TaxID=2593676 RepID=UPI00234BC782|nr:class I SAM-dependent methyltransferase [Streptomyces sp. M92]WCN05103.1 class I SAM-dependent methyltransferase [Streptomyces sp. M92]